MNKVPFNLKLNWLFNGIGLIHFGVFFFEIFDLKVNLINYSANIFGTPWLSSQPRFQVTFDDVIV